MNVTYDYYRIFYYVAVYGSFTKAANLLNSSQPNITRAMNNLEAQLGVVLLHRSRRGVTLTEEGVKLYGRVRVAFEQITLAEQEMEASKHLEAGVVTIGVSEIALHEILLPVLSGFRKQYPKIAIRITNESTPSAVQSLREGIVDFALVTTPIAEEDFFQCDEIRSFREYAVASKEGFAIKKDRLKIRELAKYPLIMLAEGTGTRSYYEELFARHQVEVNPQMIAATADQILPMVKASLGIGFVPESMIPQDEKLMKIMLVEEVPERKICLVTDRERPLGMAATTLADSIRKL